MAKVSEVNLAVRVTEAQHEKLLAMAQATGSSKSWIVRRLIDESELASPFTFQARPKPTGKQPQPA